MKSDLSCGYMMAQGTGDQLVTGGALHGEIRGGGYLRIFEYSKREILLRRVDVRTPPLLE